MEGCLVKTRQPFQSRRESNQLEAKRSVTGDDHHATAVLRSLATRGGRAGEILPVLVGCLFVFRLTRTGWTAAGKHLAQLNAGARQ